MKLTWLTRRTAWIPVLVLAGIWQMGCSCPSTNPDVTPNCPGGTRAASGISISANFASIRPIGQTIQLKIHGNRTATDQCFQPGAQTSFLVPNWQGTGTATQAEPNLADGSWTVEIEALSGGDQAPVTINKTLVAGQTHNLSISGDAAGALTATFTN